MSSRLTTDFVVGDIFAFKGLSNQDVGEDKNELRIEIIGVMPDGRLECAIYASSSKERKAIFVPMAQARDMVSQGCWEERAGAESRAIARRRTV